MIDLRAADLVRAWAIITSSGVRNPNVPRLVDQIANELAQERERCARDAERATPRHTECGNRIAAGIRDGRYRS